MSTHSLREAARKLNLSPSALSKYARTGKIPAPKAITTGGITVHLWTNEDIENVRQLLPKIANGRKTRYKKQTALSSQQSAKAKGKTKSKKKK
ncbi:MAG TPA: hypothetical protein VJV96_06765 [Candidatus Angelobacter sp.]|nr:hypothetical protein [Candidatus Angelobacter sp.]